MTCFVIAASAPQPPDSSPFRLPAAPLLESTPLRSAPLNLPGHGNLDAFHIRAIKGPKFLIYGFFNNKLKTNQTKPGPEGC